VITSFHINDSGVPIYVQIREQFLRAIGSGALKPGEQLPAMRQVAVALKVDLNTVRHAYDELQEAGAVVIARARGTYVSEKPPLVDVSAQAQKIESLAQQVIALATAAGLDPVDVAKQTIRISKLRGAKT
jgi:GntR family transcriptional regulator